MSLGYFEPTTLAQACELLSAWPDSMAIAGGTAVTLMMKQGLLAPDALVSLRHVPGLHGIAAENGRISVGAGVTLTDLAKAPLIRRHLPSLAEACGRVGNARIRNVATLGGNLAEADYASDPPSVLVSLGAQCQVESGRAARWLPVSEVITGYYATALADDELITQVAIPVVADQRAVYLKYVTRSSEDRPCVGVAATGTFEGEMVAGLQVVVGAVAAVPQRFPDITQRAVGRALEPAIVDAIASDYAQAVDPISDGRGSSWYRRRMVGVFVRRALQKLAERTEVGHAA